MNDTYNDGYKTEDIKCIIVDFIAEDGKGGFPVMRQGTYVLCKDCKHKSVKGKTTRYHYCEIWKSAVDETDFCSRGERKKPTEF